MTIKYLVENMGEFELMEANEYLNAIRNDLDDQSKISDAVKLIKSQHVRKYIGYLLFKSIESKEMSDLDKQNLYLLIHILQTIYNYSGEDTGVTDSEYDKLYELLNKIGEELITTPILNGKTRYHEYPTLRGTLSKIYALTPEEVMVNKSRKSLDDWINEKERELFEKTGTNYNLRDTEIYVFPKWDGVSIEFKFDESNNLVYALTRGDTETNEGQDVTFIFSTIQSRIKDPKMAGKEYGLKTEVMITTKDLEKYNKIYGTDFKNTRSIVSSIINSNEIDGREQMLDVVRLRTSVKNADGEEELQELAENAFERPYLVCRMCDREAIRTFANEHTFVDGLRCDGAVIYIKDEKLRKLLGRKDHKNQYEVAYKFNEEIAYSEITGIDFNLTTYGYLFPVARFKTKKMKGNNISNVSMGSIARFNELHLAVGDKVKILYEIIPYMTFDKTDPNCKRSGNSPIKLPETCPECGSKIEYNQTMSSAYCNNPNCGCRFRGKLVNYADKLGIEGFGETTVTKLFNAGILTDISDYYKLEKNRSVIEAMNGFGSDSAKAMILAVEKNGRNVNLDKFLGAIGIESCGEKTFAKILSKFNLDNLIELSEEMKVSELSSIKGIGDIMAYKILKGIKANEELIKKLMKYVNITYNVKKEGKFEVVFHNFRSPELAKYVEEMGGSINTNITKKTSVLLVENGARDKHTAKSDLCREKGIPIIERNEAKEFIKNLATVESEEFMNRPE